MLASFNADNMSVFNIGFLNRPEFVAPDTANAVGRKEPTPTLASINIYSFSDKPVALYRPLSHLLLGPLIGFSARTSRKLLNSQTNSLPKAPKLCYIAYSIAEYWKHPNNKNAKDGNNYAA